MADNKMITIDPALYGVSFSAKQCRNFKIDPGETLEWLLGQGWRRFRLMSYWDEHEKQQGAYDFRGLDRQIAQVKNAGGIVTLCLGVKQPRWPEYHWPKWVLELNHEERAEALISYVKQVVQRYKDNDTIISWQLENEALLSNFGQHIQIDRNRLRREYQLVKQLDPSQPIIMSTSNGWGVPLRQPRPDIVGFSLYTVMYKDGAYHRTIQKPWLYKLRKLLIQRPVFIHELQCEPWGPKAIWEMDTAEQDKSMDRNRIADNIRAAQAIGAYPIDLWGAEWWYWRYLQRDTTISKVALTTAYRV